MEKDNIIPTIDYPKFKLGIGPFFYGLVYLFRDHKKNSFKLVKHIFSDYFAKQFNRASAIYVDTAVDKEILPRPEVIGIYFGFIPFLVGSLGFITKEFKKLADSDIDSLIISLIGFYSDAGFIFNNAQTTFANRKSKGIGLTLLHLFDRPRNYFPSIHVVLVSYVYHRTCQIINKYTDNLIYGEMIKEQLSKRTIHIIESCILTKQHSVRDIAGGLALISSQDKEFCDQIAPKLIHSMFLEQSFGMKDELIQRIKSEIRVRYLDIMSYVVKEKYNNYNYKQGFVDYLKSVDFRKA